MKPKMLLKMISSGACRHLGESEGSRVANRAAELYYGYCAEHPDDSPAVKQHTEGKIYGVVALYRALQEKGMSPEDALSLTNQIFQEFAEKAAGIIRKMLKIPMLYRKIPQIFRSMIAKKYNAESGFQMKFYDTDKRGIKFDIKVCPYYNICKSMGCPELTAIFCNTDDCCYGNMHPKLQWNRETTIGRGGELCDFEIIVKD